ncbi:DUF87 domain-containing protein, partial [Patescibacteria group bacterium]|nr:DUF87 domain-containing protein [Patescibacteria group bacterium]
MEEGAAMQIVLRAAPSKWRAKAMIITRKMKQGLSLNEASQGMLGSFFSDFLKTASKGAAPKDRETQAQPVNQFQYTQQELRQLTPAEEEMLKLMEAKTLKPCFEANIRLLGSAQTQEKAGEILTHLQSSFAQFDTIDMNNFAVKKPLRKKEFIYNFSFRNFSSGFMSVLSSEELASVFHFPLYSTQTPHLQLAQAKSAAAPPNLPVEGLLIGQNVFRGAKTNVFLKQEDRRRHLYTIGQTGVGKSGLLLEMARQDIQNGQGVCVIDPHGELIEELLACIPENRLEDVILFDPADIEKPIGLNLLEYDYPEQKTFVINEMINIFEKLYDLKQTGGGIGNSILIKFNQIGSLTETLAAIKMAK